MIVTVVLVPANDDDGVGDDDEENLTFIRQLETSREELEFFIRKKLNAKNPDSIQQTLMIRPQQQQRQQQSTTTTTKTTTTPAHGIFQDVSAGLYAYHDPQCCDGVEAKPKPSLLYKKPNIRATRLAMACGQYAIRFYGNVILVRIDSTGKAVNLKIIEVEMACCLSSDLRHSTLLDMMRQQKQNQQQPKLDDDDEDIIEMDLTIPEWLGNASKNHYHDQVVLDRLASVMKPIETDSSSSSFSDYDSTADDHVYLKEEDKEVQNKSRRDDNVVLISPPNTFVTKVPLCLHCRKPAQSLCPNCEGVYFCDPPATCRTDGWSHECQCSTFALYTKRRKELSTFPFLGEWYHPLVERQCQISEDSYIEFIEKLMMMESNTNISDESKNKNSWWFIELGGWSGGESDVARNIDIMSRRTYHQGFYPLHDIPPYRPITDEDLIRYGDKYGVKIKRNSLGQLCLESWEEYYKLRGLSRTSPVALLLTFPLTMYHAIVEYGEVPVIVARMLKRPLRIHIVGAEKEIHFLDLFREVEYLLNCTAKDNDDSITSTKLELVFIVRRDMFPKSTTTTTLSMEENVILDSHLSVNLRLQVVCGTYGDSLDPNFDCGSGAPDMLICFNAGIYAYPSWRNVLQYLEKTTGCLGVFTDYNEYSATNCAALGGMTCRNTVKMNPFRQPRAMPVYSMNLPQFCNGFFYIFNPQVCE